MPLVGPRMTTEKWNRLASELAADRERGAAFAKTVRQSDLSTALEQEGALDDHERQVLTMLQQQYPHLVRLIAEFLAFSYEAGVLPNHVAVDEQTVEISGSLDGGAVSFRVPLGAPTASPSSA